jgi:hypothetical protein
MGGGRASLSLLGSNIPGARGTGRHGLGGVRIVWRKDIPLNERLASVLCNKGPWLASGFDTARRGPGKGVWFQIKCERLLYLRGEDAE